MTERVARDGDTVTVRCAARSVDFLEIASPTITPQFRLKMRAMHDVIFVSRPDFIALCHEGLALAGEPDWKALAVKLNRLWRADQARYGEAIRGRLAQATADRLHAAQDAITAEEWAVLEGK